MIVSADNRLPQATDSTLAFALYAIFRDFARQINELSGHFVKANHSAAITADTLVKTGQGVYRGFTITVTTAVGSIDIRDAVSAGTGTVIDTITMATAAGTRVEKTIGVVCETGLYVDFGAGTTGTICLTYE